MLHLARHEGHGPVKTARIAEDNGIPKKFLEQILLELKRAGYVESRMGAAGGYLLARPACEISLAQIIRLIDGHLAPTGSVSMYFYTDTPAARSPALTQVFRDIRNYLSDTLERTTLTNLLEAEKATGTP
jgi:Rrf2 family protein